MRRERLFAFRHGLFGVVFVAGAAFGCSSSPDAATAPPAPMGLGEATVHAAASRTSAAIKTPSNRVDRMSIVGRRAFLRTHPGLHLPGVNALRAGQAFGSGCDNEPDCGEDDDEGSPADDGPTNGNQAEYSLAVDASGQHVVVGFNDTRGFTLNPISVSGFAYSDDGGKTFVDGGQLPTPGSDVIGTDKYPQVFGDPEIKYLGKCNFVYFSILVKKFSDAATVQTMGFHRSRDCGHSWEGPFEVTAATNPSGTLDNGEPTDAADKEFADVDPDTGRVMLSWSNFAPSAPGGVQISTTYSDDILEATPTWSKAAVVSQGADDGQASIPRFAGSGSANAYVAWRKFPGDLTNNVGFARSLDNGATWQPPIKLAPADFFTADQALGNDRNNTSPSLAVAKKGRRKGTVYVVYANNDAKDGSDIVFQKSSDEGQTFSAPKVINSRPGADRSQWFPWVTVDDSTGRIYVFYYDQQIATTGDLTETTYLFSDDGGDTWVKPRPLSDRPFHAAWGNTTGQPNLGDYNQAVAQNGDLFAVWAQAYPVGFADGQPGTTFPVPRMAFKRVDDGRRTRVSSVDLGDVQIRESGGDGNLDPGDVAFVTVNLRNYVTNPLYADTLRSVVANVTTSTPGVRVALGTTLYPRLVPGASAANLFPFVLTLGRDFVPGTPIELVVRASADGAPVATLPTTLRTGTPSSTVIFQENFDSAPAGTLPATWTNTHSGGANTVPWTGTTSFCGNTTNAAFHVNADDGPAAGQATRFERLFSPSITVPTDADYVTLDFDVCYDTEDDPNFNVQAYDGFLLRIADLTGADKNRVLRSVLVDAFQEEFTTDGFFGYPKHFPRNNDPAYFQDMSAWAGDSAGLKHVHLRLPGMAGSVVQLRWEYTQDAGGTCADVRPGHTCGVLVDNIVMKSVVSVAPPRRAIARR